MKKNIMKSSESSPSKIAIAQSNADDDDLLLGEDGVVVVIEEGVYEGVPDPLVTEFWHSRGGVLGDAIDNSIHEVVRDALGENVHDGSYSVGAVPIF